MSERIRKKVGELKIPEELKSGFTFVVIQKDNAKGEKAGDIIALEFGARKKTEAEKLVTLQATIARNKKISDYKNKLRNSMFDAKRKAVKTLLPADAEAYNKAKDAYEEVKNKSKKQILALIA